MSLADIWTKRRLVQEIKEKSHFCDPATMRFFDSRILDRFLHSGAGIVFCTSERFNAETPRRYSVRLFDGFTVETVGEFQEHATAGQARKAMQEAARSFDSEGVKA